MSGISAIRIGGESMVFSATVTLKKLLPVFPNSFVTTILLVLVPVKFCSG
ncbi:MAG: hypothetical protein ABII03_03005 [Nanoarchaeota archaeon]